MSFLAVAASYRAALAEIADAAGGHRDRWAKFARESQVLQLIAETEAMYWQAVVDRCSRSIENADGTV